MGRCSSWFSLHHFQNSRIVGPYSVPAFAPTEGTLNDALVDHFDVPYVEWYWNALQFDGNATHTYHVNKYGSNYSYDNFGRIFRDEVDSWDPGAWADLFQAAGTHDFLTFVFFRHI